MIEKSEGLVIRTIKYSESTLIAKIFTRQHGLLSFFIPGARSGKKTALGNILQPTHYLLLDYNYQSNKNLLHIKECRLGQIHYTLMTDFVRKSIAIFYIEVLSKCIHEGEINTSLFDFMKYEYEILDTSTSNASLSLSPHRFLLGLAMQLGFYPHIDTEGAYFHLSEGVFVHYADGSYTLDANSSNHLRQILSGAELTISFVPRKILLQHLLSYFQLHIPGFGAIQSVEILHEILSA